MLDITENRKVLIVDDEPKNLQLVGEVLRRANVSFILAINGQEALETARAEKPDLILLDVMMPKPDGFEVCAELKRDPRTAEIPIIFLSAVAGSTELVSGFTAGAVDYIKKPFIREELLARVFTHLNLSAVQRKLNAQSEAKAGLIARLAHDIKNPSGAISGLASCLIEDLTNSDTQQAGEMLSMLNLIKESAEGMTDLVNGILDEARSEANLPATSPAEAIDVITVIQHLIKINQVSAKTKNIEIRFHNDFSPKIAVSRRILIEMFDNLLTNAVKYSPQGAQIDVRLSTASSLNQGLRFEVLDQADTIAPERRTTLFKAFELGELRQGSELKSHGVGLSVVKRLVDMHSGMVGVEARQDGDGNLFYIELPKISE